MATTPLPTDADWRAGIGSRAAARILDVLLLAVVGAIALVTLTDVDVDADVLEIPLAVSAAVALVAATYEILLVALSGQTIGKRLLHIQVVDVTTGKPPGLGSATIRYLLPGLPSALPIPGGPLIGLLVYLSAVWSPTRQGWHDRAAGTVVVRTAARQAVTGGWADAGPPADGPV